MAKKINPLMLTAALLLLLLFVFPMWTITLTAPQYPDGITMYIWINAITGDTPYTLQNINILNHYIGMKYIVPESIPELTYFPYFVVSMTVMGLVFAFIKNKKLYLVWLIIMIILGAMGIYDFYLWEYDYGHNLSETAPIKIPGMVYQPPLFGSKMLLNFKADSYPYWGGIAVFISMALCALAYIRQKQNPVNSEKPEQHENDKVNIKPSITEPVAGM
jgi:copper chaperone NosL